MLHELRTAAFATPAMGSCTGQVVRHKTGRTRERHENVLAGPCSSALEYQPPSTDRLTAGGACWTGLSAAPVFSVSDFVASGQASTLNRGELASIRPKTRKMFEQPEFGARFF